MIVCDARRGEIASANVESAHTRGYVPLANGNHACINAACHANKRPYRAD